LTNKKAHMRTIKNVRNKSLKMKLRLTIITILLIKKKLKTNCQWGEEMEEKSKTSRLKMA
jgi:hypothetical protein